MIEWVGIVFLIVALFFVAMMLYCWNNEIPPK